VTLLHASPRLAEITTSPVPLGSTPTFLWFGRLDAPKRPDVFVEAVAAASRKVPMRGVMLGDGPWREAVCARVRELEAPIEVVGSSDQVAAHLRDATAVCLFSGFEGVPFAVQEAMWAGRAVVLSPLPSLKWFAGDAAIYAADAGEAEVALLALADDATATERGEAAAARARSLLTPDAPFPALLSDYPDMSPTTER
jgi:glycosyltransferase involved in cell wall biosynthesis